MYPSFNSDKEFLPGAVCNSCRKIAYAKNNSQSHGFSSLPTYRNIVSQQKSLPPSTRNSPSCICNFCTTAKTNPATLNKTTNKLNSALGARPKAPATATSGIGSRATKTNVGSSAESSALMAAHQNAAEAHPYAAIGSASSISFMQTNDAVQGAASLLPISNSHNSSVNTSIMHLCRICYKVTDELGNHECRKGKDSINSLMENICPEVRLALAYKTIEQEQSKRASNSPVRLQNPAGGPSVPILLGSKNVSKASVTSSPMSHQTFAEMQKSVGMSDRQVIGVAKVIREAKGKRSIESNLRDFLTDQGDSIQEFFEIKQAEFDVKNSNDKLMKPIILCKDVNAFVRHVLLSRGHLGKAVLKKIGADGGGDFFKVCLNLILDQDQKSPEKKKPAGSSDRFKDSGVKKLLIIAIVQGIPETYRNVKVIMGFLDLQNFDFTLASDLKLINILYGLQSHSCTYPCVYCETRKGYDQKGPLRTLARIKALAIAFQSNPKNEGKNFYNAVNLPLVTGNENELILSKLPPCELHILIGIVTKIAQGLINAWDSKKFSDWARAQGIDDLTHKSGSLDGNECRKFLRKLDTLEIILPQNLHPYIKALRSFENVVQSCFGQILGPSFKEDIKDFEICYRKLGLSITPKIHILIDHVPVFCERKQKSLGYFSEQASESVHSDFRKTWENYKVSPNNPSFGEKLLRAVVIYNARHV